ncbi:MAG: hypothetical protein NG737_05885 [Omnitrophica bacterium]|nr:hypothetical protein [Candidatus Omnitrophota bacterium]
MNKIFIPSVLIALFLSVSFSLVSDFFFAKGEKVSLTEKEMLRLNNLSPDKVREYLTQKSSKAVSGFAYIKLNITSPVYWQLKLKTLPLSFLSIFFGCLLLGRFCLKNKN